ncbi:uncharacterized protein NCU09968 [Neurospora crassa OR74A]|uniref:Uncharacterized protein n=1 Tax=Neurospora crassa (strain ATCC 24698 / 74-OR23-1A / CBS 708.71 / DSM 1257 / FGSC 987) TaxID=367110 RepID=V5ILA4_NEUCR|nr:uncharacterized protein NCU09968 [Neurospora crassa OR74A]ESA42110.1 hypothetical protein, variant [Neurospora crassa OR74A]|eukprot:XP_011395021.1 uncharacterized protein NCU09968 [Neurospora crassa OR74A]
MADDDEGIPPPPLRTEGGAASKRKHQESATTEHVQAPGASQSPGVQQPQPSDTMHETPASAPTNQSPAEGSASAPGVASSGRASRRHRQLLPRTPAEPTRRKPTASGSILRGSKEKHTINELQEAYPGAFRPLKRSSFLKIVNLDFRMTNIKWKPDPTNPSDDELNKMKNRIDPLNRKIFFVFCSNALSACVAHTVFPDVPTTSETFLSLYIYTMERFGTYKQEMLWNRFYKTVIGWVRDFKSDFRFHIEYADLDKDGYFYDHDVEHTKKWAYARLDESLFSYLFSFITPYLDWEQNFTDRNSLRFFFLKKVYIETLREVAQVYMLEQRNMIKHGRGNVKFVHKSSNWLKLKDPRAKASSTFENLSVHPDFRKVELNTFIWRENVPLLTPAVEAQFNPTAFWEQHGTSHSPPPEASSPSSDSSSPDAMPVGSGAYLDLATTTTNVEDDLYGVSDDDEVRGVDVPDPFDDEMFVQQDESQPQPPKRARFKSPTPDPPPPESSGKKRPLEASSQGHSLVISKDQHSAIMAWLNEQMMDPEMRPQKTMLLKHIEVLRDTARNFDDFFMGLKRHAQHLKNTPFKPPPPGKTMELPPTKPMTITPIPAPTFPMPKPKTAPAPAPSIESIKAVKETPIPPPSIGPYKPKATPATELPIADKPIADKPIADKPIADKLPRIFVPSAKTPEDRAIFNKVVADINATKKFLFEHGRHAQLQDAVDFINEQNQDSIDWTTRGKNILEFLKELRESTIPRVKTEDDQKWHDKLQQKLMEARQRFPRDSKEENRINEFMLQQVKANGNNWSAFASNTMQFIDCEILPLPTKPEPRFVLVESSSSESSSGSESEVVSPKPVSPAPMSPKPVSPKPPTSPALIGSPPSPKTDAEIQKHTEAIQELELLRRSFSSDIRIQLDEYVDSQYDNHDIDWVVRGDNILRYLRRLCKISTPPPPPTAQEKYETLYSESLYDFQASDMPERFVDELKAQKDLVDNSTDADLQTWEAKTGYIDYAYRRIKASFFDEKEAAEKKEQEHRDAVAAQKIAEDEEKMKKAAEEHRRRRQAEEARKKEDAALAQSYRLSPIPDSSPNKAISPFKHFEHRPSPHQSPVKPLPIPLPIPAINAPVATSTPQRQLRPRPSFTMETAASRARQVSQESTPAPASTLRRTASTRGSLRGRARQQASATPDPNRMSTRSQSRTSGAAAANSPPADTPPGHARGGRETSRGRGKRGGRGARSNHHHYDDFDFEDLIADESIDPLDFYQERITLYRAGYV